MLNSNGFDLWANNYDSAVGLSDDDGTYPFAGYKDVLNTIYNSIMSASGNVILDIGFGTGTLSAKLYEQGYTIYGLDFSEKMIEIAQKKMPNAKLYQGDFTNGLTDELKNNKYDAIIATYSIHHLTDAQKVVFIKSLIPLLNEGGCIYFGDVAFQTRIQLEMCKAQAGDDWDDDEIYFVFDEINKSFPNMKFDRISHCAGVLTITK